MQALSIPDITKAIVAAYPSRQPLMIWGDPGLGKSSAGKQAADDLRAILSQHLNKSARSKQEFGFIDLRLSNIEEVDLRGMPYNKDGAMCWSRPDFIPATGQGILMLDEMPQGTPGKQSAASQLVLDRRCGPHVLGDGWHVIAAGNLLSNRAATYAMPTHMANRFVHLQAVMNVDAWVAWALRSKIDMRVIAYIKWRPTMLHAFDPKSKSPAFASPRSWEFVSKILTSFGQNIDSPILRAMISGAVGDGPVAEFLAFCKMYAKLPDIDSIFMNPKKAAIPTEINVLWAVVTSLSARISPDNIDKVVTYFNRVTDEAGKPEMSIAAMKELSFLDEQKADDKKITKTRSYIEWCAKHNEFIV